MTNPKHTDTNRSGDLAGVDELVGRLREQRPEGEPISVARLMDAAADTIQSLAAQLAEIQTVLSDQQAVHVNMLRGGIAKPSHANIWHLYGRELADAMPDEYRTAQLAEARDKALEEAAAAYEAETHTWTAWPEAGAARRKGAKAIRALKGSQQ